jgi:hypothetical protein
MWENQNSQQQKGLVQGRGKALQSPSTFFLVALALGPVALLSADTVSNQGTHFPSRPTKTNSLSF